MFDKLVMLTDGQTIYRGRVDALVPFLADIGLECPSYHNPVSGSQHMLRGPNISAPDISPVPTSRYKKCMKIQNFRNLIHIYQQVLTNLQKVSRGHFH